MMKKLTMAAAIAAALSTPGVAQASLVATLECGLIRISPPDNDRDPTIKTKVSMVWSPASALNPTDFSVEHYSAAGNVYSRSEQYRSIRLWSNRDSDNWSGVSIRNPALTMVGTVYTERGRTFYVERQTRTAGDRHQQHLPRRARGKLLISEVDARLVRPLGVIFTTQQAPLANRSLQR